MDSPHNIQSVLNDLYQEDPSLRSQTKELTLLIETLLASRPEAMYDPTNRAKLKQELLATYIQQHPSQTHFDRFFSTMSSFFTRTPWLAPAGALVLVIGVVSASTWQHPASTIALAPTQLTANTLPPHAFGDLTYASTQNARSSSGGGSAPTATLQAGVASEKMMASDSLIARPIQEVRYRYVYTGDLPHWDAQLPVYKRVKGSAPLPSLMQPLAETTRGLIDLASLQNMGLQSFTAQQNEPFGYSLTADLVEGSVSLNQNYSQWPHPESSCQQEDCFQRLRLSPTDIPSDEEAIQIATAFFQSHGISTTSYGTPQVNSDWRRQYETATDKSLVYVPDVVTITYPVLLDGKASYEEGGTAFGLTINVNSRSRKVDSVWNLTSNTYQSSAYEAETDEARIRGIVEKGGIYTYQAPEAKNVVDVSLETPDLVLERVWVADQSGAMMKELLVPALRFVIKNKPTEGYVPDVIMVPLVKEVLDQQRSPIQIMMR